MPITEENIRNIRRRIPSAERLHASRLKATPPRTTIIDLFRKSRTPLCVEDIQSRLSDIRQSTLYRTLKLLEDQEIIIKTGAPSEYATTTANKRKRAFYAFS